jgi:hypothetical protein
MQWPRAATCCSTSTSRGAPLSAVTGGGSGGVFPPSWDELERRLRARRTEDDATVVRRLTRAREEAQALLEYDYWLVNRDVQETITRLEAIVAAERAKVARIVVEGEIP